ncbi:MAG: hypothetical protein CMJ72_07715 [Planctomycetaceae bacterium]|nr:hypothetical protein [Planctomycetaceae bacterium]HCK40808.1 hypothetical protein [Planctomycetaceae bacterium]
MQYDQSWHYWDRTQESVRNVYGFIEGTRPAGDFATFVDGRSEIAICDAVLKSNQAKAWVDVEY